MSFFAPFLMNDYIASGTAPDDLVEITPDEHAEYSSAPPAGMKLSAGSDGRPKWIEIPRPARPTLDEVRASAMRRINAGYQAEVDALLADYPQAETATFGKQAAEAETFYATGDPDDAPMLAIIAEHRGIELVDLVSKVLEKAGSYTTAIATLTGKRQRLEDAALAATTADELGGLAWGI